MTTVVRRVFASTPARDASDTWSAIVALLSHAGDARKKAELMSVAGIAASIITDQATLEAPIVVTCDGPRTRIYCLFDEDAVEGSDANEDILGFDPLEGDWSLSLPCLAEDLGWVQNALKTHSKRITARDLADGIAIEKQAAEPTTNALVFDAKGFLGS